MYSVINMVDNNSLVLGKKLKELRKSFCMTQDQIAELLQMSRTSFSKYENGAANPPLAVMRKLAKIYGVSIEYLIHDDITSIELNEAKTDHQPDPNNLAEYFAQLTPEERMLIMKLRLMDIDKKKAFLSKLDDDEE